MTVIDLVHELKPIQIQNQIKKIGTVPACCECGACKRLWGFLRTIDADRAAIAVFLRPPKAPAGAMASGLLDWCRGFLNKHHCPCLQPDRASRVDNGHERMTSDSLGSGHARWTARAYSHVYQAACCKLSLGIIWRSPCKSCFQTWGGRASPSAQPSLEQNASPINPTPLVCAGTAAADGCFSHN